jgi:hemerythrin
MNENKLTQLLEQLQHELSGTQAVDEKGRELLRALNAEIQNLLERTDDAESNDTLLKRLQDTIDHFEKSHPTLTAALSHMLNSLSNAGI